MYNLNMKIIVVAVGIALLILGAMVYLSAPFEDVAESEPVVENNTGGRHITIGIHESIVLTDP
jgi:uncharacterized membrane protein